eukprot:808809-Rhodomonas_salina.3
MKLYVLRALSPQIAPASSTSTSSSSATPTIAGRCLTTWICMMLCSPMLNTWFERAGRGLVTSIPWKRGSAPARRFVSFLRYEIFFFFTQQVKTRHCAFSPTVAAVTLKLPRVRLSAFIRELEYTSATAALVRAGADHTLLPVSSACALTPRPPHPRRRRRPPPSPPPPSSLPAAPQAHTHFSTRTPERRPGQAHNPRNQRQETQSPTM